MSGFSRGDRLAAMAAAISALAACTSACTSAGAPPAPEETPCADGLERLDDRCVEPARRYEPDDPVDGDNVVSYSDPPGLDLPDPPKAGFRLVMPPVDLAAGEEQEFCVSWPFPAGQSRDLVYAAVLYTTGGLHHSNVFSSPVDAELGANPYPGCHPGGGDPFAQVGEAIPDVLFANSTQVVGGESLIFPAGMGYRVHHEREVVANVHVLNTSGAPQRVEVVYDFYTMPEEALDEELAPFVLDNRAFSIPPMQTETIEADCPVWDGNIVSVMPHTHQFSERFAVETMSHEGVSTLIYEDTGYDQETDIVVFDEAPSLAEATRLKFSCTFRNTKSSPLVYGLGDQEMCILFGYMYPIDQQFAGMQSNLDDGCQTIRIGIFQP
ncbi:MAG: hypothetical protein R3B72_33225 [Polyangiaceae bacterium]